jgi:hypothetical protein
VAPGTVQEAGHRDAGAGRDDEVEQHGGRHHRPEREVVVEEQRAEAGDPAPHQSIHEADRQFLAHELSVLIAQLVEGEARITSATVLLPVFPPSRGRNVDSSRQDLAARQIL